MSNIDAVKKDDLVYYSVRRKEENGYELLFNSSFPYEDPTYKLTSREIEIIKLISAGKTTQEVADILGLSKHTINTHRKNMLKKTNVGNVTELMSVLMYKGLL